MTLVKINSCNGFIVSFKLAEVTLVFKKKDPLEKTN